MDFKWDEQHKANRLQLLKSPPTFTQLIDKVKSFENISKEQRALFSMAIITGARISELCGVKQKDIKFYNYHDIELPYDKLYAFDVAKIIITLDNLKNRRQKSKNIPVIKNDMFAVMIEYIVERVKEQGYNPEQLIYSRGRKNAWWDTKKFWGADVFPHYFRHCYVSNLAAKGIPVPTIKNLAGWSSVVPFSVYEHLATKTLEEDLKRAYGENLEKLERKDPVLKGDNVRPLTYNQIAGAYVAANQLKPMDVRVRNSMAKGGVFEKEDGSLVVKQVPRDVRKVVAAVVEKVPEVENIRKEKLEVVRARLLAKKFGGVKESDVVSNDYLQVV